MAKIIFESELTDLLATLAARAEVYVPAHKNPQSTFSQCAFMPYSEGLAADFNYHTSVLPPKEFFLPAEDTIFNFREGSVARKKPAPKIIFGLNLNDLTGVNRLKKIFESPIEDAPFKEAAEQITLVVIDRFSPPTNEPFDLYLMRLSGDRLAGYAGSKKGQQILKSPLFKTKDISIPKVKRNLATRNDKEIAQIVAGSRNHPIWKELAEICLGCGICSYSCPLCYCFEVADRIDFGTEKNPSGDRCRTWDSCLLKSFAATNAGNPRADLADRIYNWYHHKFVRMPKEYGFSGCIDCHRCVIYCPAKISYQKTLARLEADWKAQHEKL